MRSKAQSLIRLFKALQEDRAYQRSSIPLDPLLLSVNLS